MRGLGIRCEEQEPRDESWTKGYVGIMSLLLFVLLILLPCFTASDHHPKFLDKPTEPPKWPTKYHVTGTLYLPYVEIEEPFEAWYDEDNKRSRIDLYSGVSKTLQRGDLGPYGQWYVVHPWTTETVRNQKICFLVNGTEHWKMNRPQPMIPDIKDFHHIGDAEHKGIAVHVFQLKEDVGDKRNTYTLFVEKSTGNPVWYKMHGYNNVQHSHYDEYVIEYDELHRNFSGDVFDKATDGLKCQDYPDDDRSLKMLVNPMKEYVHPVDESHVHSAHEEFKRKYSKHSTDNHEERKNTFRHNLRYINSMNRRNLTFKLKVNHFADVSDEEHRFGGLKVTPRHLRGDVGEDFDAGNPNDPIPTEKNWRLYGAVTQVKDQAICGSCWSFGAAGSVESAYFIKTGHLLRLSQQQQIDCSWGFGNAGCFMGGEHWRAFKYMKKHGLATEEEYGPYLAINSYCHDDLVKTKINVTGYVNVPTGNETALRIALSRHGPVAVGMDSSHKSFRFYSHGIYTEPKCGKGYEDMGHLVLAVGYGSLDGEPYWLIKNSWSSHWGNDGYFLITRKENMCGITTDAAYPLVS